MGIKFNPPWNGLPIEVEETPNNEPIKPDFMAPGEGPYPFKYFKTNCTHNSISGVIDSLYALWGSSIYPYTPASYLWWFKQLNISSLRQLSGSGTNFTSTDFPGRFTSVTYKHDKEHPFVGIPFNILFTDKDSPEYHNYKLVYNIIKNSRRYSPPVVIPYKQEYYILDGRHRVESLAHLLTPNSQIYAWVVGELDKSKKPRPFMATIPLEISHPGLLEGLRQEGVI